MSATASRYDELCDLFPLRPIHTEKAHGKALDTMISLANENDRDAIDYKIVLGKLIADYESEAGHRIDTTGVSAADVVRHLLAERRMSVTAFAKAINVSQGTLNDTLAGKRTWSKSMIVKVADFFGLSADLFLRD